MNMLLHIRKVKLNKNEEAPIYLRITINRKRAEISCKQFVFPEKWSLEAEKIKRTKEDIKAINNHLFKLKTKVDFLQKTGQKVKPRFYNI